MGLIHPLDVRQRGTTSYWIWQVRSIEEAVEWIKRAPFDGGVEVTLRPIFEFADFGKEVTPEMRAQEEQLRGEIERQRKS